MTVSWSSERTNAYCTKHYNIIIIEDLCTPDINIHLKGSKYKWTAKTDLHTGH